MATLRELIIKISANSSSFQSEIARASRMGTDYYRTMEQGGKKAAAATRETQRSLADLNSQLATVRSSAAGLAGAWAGAFATHQLIQFADTWNQLNGRLRLASSSSEDYVQSQRVLMEISQRTGTSLEANSNLYSRIAQSLRDAGYASADVAKVTETVATSLKLSGASTEEASSVITQLSQALGSGVLRGEEFNAIMESGGRLAKLLADGLGTTVGGLRNMANNGQLTTEKIMPLLTNVDQLRKEFDTLPASVSGSAQKVENAFMAWVGGANDAVGASSALAGVLDGLANNITGVANGLGVLTAVGVARYFGNVASSAATATSELLNNYKSQVSLASAQAYAAAQVQRKAAADAEAATSAYNLALAETNVAKGSNASMIATDNLIKKRSEMIAANARLIQSNRAVSASQDSLNKVTGTVSMLRTGANGLLSLVGGIPGAILAMGAAWLYVYEKNEQARKSALEYGEAIANAKPVSGLVVQGNNSNEIDKTAVSMRAQAEEISKLNSKIAELTQQQYNARAAMKNSEEGSWSYNTAQESLVEINGQLADAERRRDEVSKQLVATTDRHNVLLRQNAAAANVYYSNLLQMTGQGAAFRQVLDGINAAIEHNNSLTASPFRLPQATVSDKDAQTLLQKQQQASLASLTGIEKVRQQAQYDLQKMGRTGPENATYAASYIKAAEDEYNNTQNVAAAQKAKSDATRAAEKADRDAAQQAEQYSRKMADLSVAIEVQKVRASEGEQAAELYAAANQTGAKWTDEQRKAIQAQSAELARLTQLADDHVKKVREQADALKDLTEAARKFNDDAALTTETAGMSDRQRSRFDETQQIDRVFAKAGGDKSTQAVIARGEALDALDKKYKAIAAAEADWMSGVSRGYANWFDEISNVSGTVSDGVKTTLDSAFGNVTSMLEGNKVSWRSWGISVLQIIEKVALQMAVVSAMGGASSGSGIFGSLIGSVGSFFGGGAGASASTGTAVSSYGSNFQFNAKGGVYDSPSLSAFSNGIVRNPTMFAFAKGGAGIMGEAGPEAIMPLTRAPDGSLGVRAVGGGGGQSVSSAPQVYITIDGNGNTQTQASPGLEQFGAEVGEFVDRRYKQNVMRDIRPGGDIWNAMKGTR
ncbi:phage tail tape measure protein [Enterobacter sichuanensis]|uniref:phage tail tape measure protein n=1 Tax=Enterobacter sichuanensis TaxID=2071710 RepID=UPI0029119AB7|nr:phage tail tape measure protein [Enterobacter sichuanensis]MDU5196892.1 phage tail tape measure protein [Enterobacter sichuanensis]MDU5389494.1 phage tail tape measure protein [Enterobacter sichuanensis]